MRIVGAFVFALLTMLSVFAIAMALVCFLTVITGVVGIAILGGLLSFGVSVYIGHLVAAGILKDNDAH